VFRIDDDTFIDATDVGGLARYINHSCEPNCESRTIPFEGRRRVVIFAKNDIDPCEELCYDYQLPWEGKDHALICLCGSSKCRGYLNCSEKKTPEPTGRKSEKKKVQQLRKDRARRNRELLSDIAVLEPDNELSVEVLQNLLGLEEIEDEEEEEIKEKPQAKPKSKIAEIVEEKKSAKTKTKSKEIETGSLPRARTKMGKNVVPEVVVRKKGKHKSMHSETKTIEKKPLPLPDILPKSSKIEKEKVKSKEKSADREDGKHIHSPKHRRKRMMVPELDIVKEKEKVEENKRNLKSKDTEEEEAEVEESLAKGKGPISSNQLLERFVRDLEITPFVFGGGIFDPRMLSETEDSDYGEEEEDD
jgi:hypothetical protein